MIFVYNDVTYDDSKSEVTYNVTTQNKVAVIFNRGEFTN